jgi:ornithine cyclodeaminase/alanine dehydrogenase-like protein (mu-crystallin family)
MRLLVLSRSDVHELLGYGECADAVRDALAALVSGRADQPLRTVLRPSGATGLMALMPSYLADAQTGYGLKALCITPSNPAAGLDTHQGIVLLSDAATGEPAAVLNASAVTEIRTAAVSVVATELLARPEADVLAVIGTGVQARAHIVALDGARTLNEIRVAGRAQGRAESLAAGLQGQTAAPVRPCGSVREALESAGIVVTATNSAVPVLRGEWLDPGTHVNAVGACVPGERELDTAAVAAGVLFADRRESLLAESGDYLLAAAEGAVTSEAVRAELGELLAGGGQGRMSTTEITIFESLGLAIEDLAAASCAYRKAVATEAGSWVEF